MLWVKLVIKKKGLLTGDLSRSCCKRAMGVALPGMITVSVNLQSFKPMFYEGSGLIKLAWVIKVKRS